MDIDNRAPQTIQELEQMGAALAKEMCAPLTDRVINTGVILQALMTMHRVAVRRLPAGAQRDIGFAMANYAGELIATPYAAPGPEHQAHQFPTDLPTAIQ